MCLVTSSDNNIMAATISSFEELPVRHKQDGLMAFAKAMEAVKSQCHYAR